MKEIKEILKNIVEGRFYEITYKGSWNKTKRIYAIIEEIDLNHSQIELCLSKVHEELGYIKFKYLLAVREVQLRNKWKELI